MSPDDIDSIAVDLHDLLINKLGCCLDEDDDFQIIHEFLVNNLDKFTTRDRNYN